MGVYIPKIELPKNDEIIMISRGGYVEWSDIDGSWECESKAIELPTHGRLIDADALMLKIKDYIEEYSAIDENGFHNLKWCAMKEAEMAIKDAPAIIEAEEGK